MQRRNDMPVEGVSHGVALNERAASGYGKLIPFPEPHIRRRRRHFSNPLRPEVPGTLVADPSGPGGSGVADRDMVAQTHRNGIRLRLVSKSPAPSSSSCAGDTTQPVNARQLAEFRPGPRRPNGDVSADGLEPASSSKRKPRGAAGGFSPDAASPGTPSTNSTATERGAAQTLSTRSGSGHRWSTILLLLAYTVMLGVIAQRLAMATSWTASLVLLGSVQFVLAILTFAGSRAQMTSEGAASRAGRRDIAMPSS